MVRPKPLKVVPLAMLGLLSACATSDGNDTNEAVAPLEALLAPRARLALTNPSSAVSQTGDRTWTLAKTGAVDAASSTVTWAITATPSATASHRLVVNGHVTVQNVGMIGAPIGNIVVNLQARTGSSWVTRSSNVANATLGDAATTARVVVTSNCDLDVDDDSATAAQVVTVSENAASGPLAFSQGDANTPFSLVPQVTIAPGATLRLHFTTSFDNDVLAIPVDRPVRAEIVVTAGNAGNGNRTARNVDINGNGTIDPNEAQVRTKARQLGAKPVPAPAPGTNPVLSDTVADLSTTGTVTFTNPVFDLGATTGTATASYDGGSAGGTITNCAHLTGSGLDLTACDTQTIAAACAPGAPGCGWSDGDLVTFRQVDWGDVPSGNNAAAILANNFVSIYAPSGELVVGIDGVAGFSMVFTSATAVLGYLPALGLAGTLDADLLDPTSSASGVFGGDVVTLKLNRDFSAAALIGGTSGLQFGDLRLCGFSSPAGLNGLTVGGFLAIANTVLGGGAAPFTVAELAPIALELNTAFFAGLPSAFAQAHLINGSCP